MSASSFTYSTALAGQGLSFSGTGSPDSGAQATGSLRPSRLELQAVLARAQARKGSLAQAATDECELQFPHFNTHADDMS